MKKRFFAGEFKQRTVTFFENDIPGGFSVNSISGNSQGVYIGAKQGFFVIKNGKPEKLLDGNTALVFSFKGETVFAAEGKKIFKVCGEKAELVFEADSPAAGFSADGDTLWLASEEKLYKYNGEGFSLYCENERSGIKLITSSGNGDVFESDCEAVYSLWGKRPRWGTVVPETSRMPEGAISSIAADSCGYLWLGTVNGVVVYDGQSEWYTYKQLDFLPRDEITCLEISADGGRVFAGTKEGLYIIDGTRRSFLPAERWMPGGVTCVYEEPESKKLFIGTENGAAIIDYVPMTLQQKAEHFENVAAKYHIREGYFTARTLFEKNNMEKGTPRITDNDGLWTAIYLVTESCRYAVTGSEEAREAARQACAALIKLNKVTGIPGFPARAYRRPGEDRFGDGDPEWHLTSDEKGTLEWKGETSSDETSGHYFGFSYYYDLCADDEEKKQIAEVIRLMTDHVLEHNYTLCDADGLPTTWARWAPEDMNRGDMWRWERGINSLELLCMLKVALHMTGDEKYAAEYKRLINREHYALNSAAHKMDDGHSNHIDDHLGFIVMATFLRLEEDPAVRKYLLFGLRHHWNYERVERSPLGNIVFGCFTDDAADIEAAAQSLIELPLSFIDYPIKNSQRRELVWDHSAEKFGEPAQLAAPLPYDEKPVTNYDGNPFMPDGGRGFNASEPTIYLLPYWLGRYFGILGD